MAHTFFKESPFKTLISFHKLIEALEEIAFTNIDYRANYAKALLQEIERFPVQTKQFFKTRQNLA
ncbi:hypothetical protein [Flavobacterium sp. RSP15]|uniref:hypothetical protein n=1 Tax=Flavobacterium sp. RSP15 TaxID=2497485 RepID=UPI000F838308|nr:hypothetical protein [Flavobacterium sp. RSP15]RTY87766.1 hypothetical protein EKM00_05640 [Flavobacterium sp. RSP15]